MEDCVLSFNFKHPKLCSQKKNKKVAVSQKNVVIYCFQKKQGKKGLIN